MESTDTTSYRRPLHGKKSFGVAKHTISVDSPAYDASEEDNDPLTDDGASMSGPVPRTSNALSGRRASATANSRFKHAVTADDTESGIDSPTYDGDIESSTTAGPDNVHYPHSPSKQTIDSTLTSPVSAVFPTPPPIFIQHPSMDQTSPVTAVPPSEPTPPPVSEAEFSPASLTAEDIQEAVNKAIAGETHRKYKINPPPVGRPVRIYADGVYDIFHFGHALQLRQAKLSFPSVHLLAGVCSDELVREHKSKCESVRHCRWVDEIVQEAPWIIDQDFIDKYEIDYVAHDEEPYASATTGHDDAYGFVKSLGKFIPTRRTPGVSTSELLERIVAGYRKLDWDAKLEKMGKPELMAAGSDYDSSREGSIVNVDIRKRK
ncbi:hypothetical protein SISNIDRAFT_489355 [Sistotremastrum niveocremeum HHB9708]|uniref:choline-phosphate cytidylyltransferase n=1 Tax=Sistotremastrum niveocremeum HHB9708 TaxID=1314777 RepID=A0A164Q7F1_9AGAM|nr:hypothetical protein SISNIDRAFT_489355 [Sistotremastrum niveocremeum HHB9708]